jgi:hypothetical protein
VVGQSITVSGFAAPYDSFNGTFVLKSFTSGGAFSFDQAGVDVATHAVDGMLQGAPTGAGSFSFTVQARDGAKQVGTRVLSVVVE